MTKRCEAVTKKGKPCQGAAMWGSRYCGPHTDHPPDDTERVQYLLDSGQAIPPGTYRVSRTLRV